MSSHSLHASKISEDAKSAGYSSFSASITSISCDFADECRLQAKAKLDSGDPAGAAELFLRAAERNLTIGHPAEALADFTNAIDAAPEPSLSISERRALTATDIRHADASSMWMALASKYEAAGAEHKSDQSRALWNAALVASDGNEALLQKACDICESHWGHHARGFAALMSGNLNAARDHAMRALSDARHSGDLLLEECALQTISLSHCMSGNPSDAIPTLLQVTRLAQNRCAYSSMTTAWINLIEALCDDLQTENALRSAEELMHYLQHRELGEWTDIALSRVALLHARMGNLDKALDESRESFASVLARGFALEDVEVAMTHATILLDAGRIDASFEQAIDALNSFGTPLEKMYAAWFAARAADVAGDTDLATQLSDDIEADDSLAGIRFELWKLRRSVALGIELDATPRSSKAPDHCNDVRLIKLEIAATHHAMQTGETENLGAVIEQWKQASRTLDASRATISLAYCSLHHGDRPLARKQMTSALATLQIAGAAHDIALIETMLNENSTISSHRDIQLQLSQYLQDVPEFDAATMHTFEVEEGHEFFARGDSPTNIHLLVQGRVRVFRSAGQGRNLTLSVLDPGDFVGETLIVQVGPCNDTAEALENCIVASIPLDLIRSIAHRSPHLKARILQSALASVEHARQLAESVVFWDISRRLAWLLLDLDKKFGHPTTSGGRIINRAFTQVTLGEMIGAGRQATVAAFRDLVKQGVVERRGRRIVISDLAALQLTANPDA